MRNSFSKEIALFIILLVFATAMGCWGSTPKEIAQQALTEIQTQKVSLSKAKSATAQALKDLANAKTENDNLTASLEEAKAQTVQALVDLKAREDEVVSLQADVKVWQAKQAKALKELWIYRSIIIAVVGAVGIGLLFKLGILGAKIAS
jgi:hypothetical protein